MKYQRSMKSRLHLKKKHKELPKKCITEFMIMRMRHNFRKKFKISRNFKFPSFNMVSIGTAYAILPPNRTLRIDPAKTGGGVSTTSIIQQSKAGEILINVIKNPDKGMMMRNDNLTATNKYFSAIPSLEDFIKAVEQSLDEVAIWRNSYKGSCVVSADPLFAHHVIYFFSRGNEGDPCMNAYHYVLVKHGEGRYEVKTHVAVISSDLVTLLLHKNNPTTLGISVSATAPKSGRINYLEIDKEEKENG